MSWPAAQILAVEVQEIEGKVNDPVPRPVDGRAEGVKIGDAVLVLDNHLAIEQGGFAGELGAGLDHPPVALVQSLPFWVKAYMIQVKD
jgi:hypothetical protein